MLTPARLPIRIQARGSSYQLIVGDPRAKLYAYIDHDPGRAAPSDRLSATEAKALVIDIARALRDAWSSPPIEELLYTVEEWALDKSQRLEIVARVHLLTVGYAAFRATVEARPQSRIVLRKAALELEAYAPQGREPAAS